MAGTIKIGLDKGCLRLQFPSAVSQKTWGIRQKYLALGLSNTPENMAMAQHLASQAQMDLLSGNLDKTLEKYKPPGFKKTLEPIKAKTPELMELYAEFIETVIKPSVDQNTYKTYEVINWNRINLCSNADIVADSTKIFDTLKIATTPSQVRRTLDILYNLLEWCKRRGIVERDTYNPYREYKQDAPGKSKQVKPKHIIDQDLVEDDDFRGYSPEEAEHIVNALAFRGSTKNLYRSFGLFLFLTGCRPSEAIGLQWQDVNEDCSVITFRRVFCATTKEEKGLKTRKFGKDKRKFPCGERLQNLLKEMRKNQENLNPKSKVFVSKNGKPVDWHSFYQVWSGRHDNFTDTDGVVEILAREKKVRFYLKPYATRHSFITWQLATGSTPTNVAKMVGNSPEMIYKHYVSADEDLRVTFEVRAF
jgi:integrase